MRILHMAVVVSVAFASTPVHALGVYYSSAAAFALAAPGLPTETFSAIDPGVGGIAVIDAPLSNANNAGLLAGITYDVVLKSGIGKAGLAATGVNFFSLASASLFTNSFGDTLRLIFSPNVTAASFDISSLTDSSSVVVSTFGTGGLLSTTTVSATNSGAGTFLGQTSTQAITEIDLVSTGSQASGISNFSFGNPAAVPEPTGLVLLGIGFAGVGAIRRRKA